jgi:hypothetical protein
MHCSNSSSIFLNWLGEVHRKTLTDDDTGSNRVGRRLSV